MADLVDMHRSLNLRDWLERRSYEQARQEAEKRK